MPRWSLKETCFFLILGKVHLTFVFRQCTDGSFMWSIELFGVLLFFPDDSTCKIGGNSDDLPGIWVICKDQADTETLSDLVIKIFHDVSD